MKRMVFIFCGLIFFNSCRDKRHNYIVTNTYDYWVVDDEYYQNTFACYAYQFYENGEYKLFVIRKNKKQIHPYSGGDVIYLDNKWKLFDDSIKIGSNNFKLDIINDKELFIKSKGFKEKLLKMKYKEDYIKMKDPLN